MRDPLSPRPWVLRQLAEHCITEISQCPKRSRDVVQLLMRFCYASHSSCCMPYASCFIVISLLPLLLLLMIDDDDDEDEDCGAVGGAVGDYYDDGKTR